MTIRPRWLIPLALVLSAPAAARDFSRQNDLTARDAALRSLSVEGQAATPCDFGQWTADPHGTQSPIPDCYGVRVGNATATAYPSVVGIGAENGSAVPENDPTFLQRAQFLVQARTALGNANQESGAAINFVSRTGGGGLPQTNHNQKVALTVFTLAQPGSSNVWGINNDFHIHAGVGNYPGFRHEGDMTNFNCDYAPNGPCGVAVGDFLTYTGKPVTASMMVTGNPEAGSKSMYYGLLFQGAAGFTDVGTGLVSDATFRDDTNARDSIFIGGKHSAGINTTQGNVFYALQMAAGQKICMGVFDGCLSYDATNKLINLNDGKHLLHAETGDLSIAGGLYAQGSGPLLLGTRASGAALEIVPNGGPAANRVHVEGAGAGFGPQISARGSDANVPLILSAKGTSPVQVAGGLVVTGDAQAQSYSVAGSPGVSCAGPPSANFQVTNGLVTRC